MPSSMWLQHHQWTHLQHNSDKIISFCSISITGLQGRDRVFSISLYLVPSTFLLHRNTIRKQVQHTLPGVNRNKSDIENKLRRSLTPPPHMWKDISWESTLSWHLVGSSGCQAWALAPLPTKPSCWLNFCFFLYCYVLCLYYVLLLYYHKVTALLVYMTSSSLKLWTPLRVVAYLSLYVMCIMQWYIIFLHLRFIS